MVSWKSLAYTLAGYTVHGLVLKLDTEFSEDTAAFIDVLVSVLQPQHK